MRLLAACSLGGAGHLQPLVPFLAAARLAGDEVMVVGPPAIAPMVDAAGLAFWAGGEPTEAEVAPVRERLPVAPEREASILGNRELFGRLATAAMLPAVDAAVADWAPDLILREPCEYASAIVAAGTGTRVAQVAISLAGAEWRSMDDAGPVLESWCPGLVGVLRATPYLSRFPGSLDPSPFVDTRRHREEGSPGRNPLPDWWSGAGGPLVYLTFGTVLGYMALAADAFRLALRAVEPLDARVLLTVGRRFDPDRLGPLPPQVHVEPWVDQADVMTEADVVVCHGGSGTAFGALAAGVPVVSVPHFADQFANGRRIAEAGAGLVVEADRPEPPAGSGGQRPRLGPADVPRLTAAIETVLYQGGYREAARRVAEEMAAAPTAGETLARLLEGG